MNNKDDKCVSRSRLRNVGSSLIFHYFHSCGFFLPNCLCIPWCKCIMTHTGSHFVAHQARAHMWRHTHTHVCRSTRREVCWISKWKWKFEPQVWHCDMQSTPLANLFEWLCAQPDRWLPGDFSCARGPSACPPRPHHRSSLSLSATTT